MAFEIEFALAAETDLDGIPPFYRNQILVLLRDFTLLRDFKV